MTQIENKNIVRNISVRYPMPKKPQTLRHMSLFVACLVGTVLACIGAYFISVDRLVQRSDIPATYKWFLLKHIPGPRIIFESGSNTHHAIDTDAVSQQMGITAINIADNGGYALEDKISRLETHTRAGDIVVLPLEWTFYHREKLTDNYAETLFSSNRDYYSALAPIERAKRALSLPPSKVFMQLSNKDKGLEYETESPAKQLFNAALTQTSGHRSKANSSGPGLGVEGQSCDDYVFGKAAKRKALALGDNIKPALARLKKLEARGVKIHFAWPVLAGDGCMSDPTYITGFRQKIEMAVNAAGFEFLGTAAQSLYGQNMQDDTPYHLITNGTIQHTQQMIGFLKAQGYGGNGKALDIQSFARERLLEMEIAQTVSNGHKPRNQPALPLDTTLAVYETDLRPYVHFTAGWWAFEPYGRWMRDTRAMLQVTLPKDMPNSSILKLNGITKTGRPERVTVSVNGQVIGSGMFGQSLPLSLPVGNLPRGERLSIFIDLPEIDTPQSPYDLGENEDTRTMSLHLQSLQLLSAAGAQPAAMQLTQNSSPKGISPINPLAANPLPANPVLANPLPANPVLANPEQLAAHTPAIKTAASHSAAPPRSAPDYINAGLGYSGFTNAGFGNAVLSNAGFGSVDFNSVGTGNLNSCAVGFAAPQKSVNRPLTNSVDYANGWWPLEPEGRWMRGMEAEFSVPLARAQSGSNRLALEIIGDFFLSQPKPVYLDINGQNHGPLYADARGQIRTEFTRASDADDVKVRVRIDGNISPSPKALGLSPDERTLSYFMKSVRVIPSPF